MSQTLNQIIESESGRLQCAIMQAVNDCKMPAAVTKIVLQNTVKDIVQIINNQIANEKPQENGEE